MLEIAEQVKTQAFDTLQEMQADWEEGGYPKDFVDYLEHLARELIRDLDLSYGNDDDHVRKLVRIATLLVGAKHMKEMETEPRKPTPSTSASLTRLGSITQ